MRSGGRSRGGSRPSDSSTGPRSPETLILVDERNRPVGAAEKHAAHRRGLLHRAFSIFLFDPEGRLLLQRRAAGKYHSAGLWANTCCGHPRPGESTRRAAARRLSEELNLEAALSFAFRARYRASLDGGMTENELVYVYGGRLPSVPVRPDPREADATTLVSLQDLQAEVACQPHRYAYWLRHYLAEHGDLLRRLAHAPSPTRRS